MSQAIKNFQIIESVEAVYGSYHVGVVLVAVEKNSERPFLARKLRLRVGSLFNDAAVFIQHSFDLATSNVQEANLDGQIESILEFPLVCTSGVLIKCTNAPSYKYCRETMLG